MDNTVTLVGNCTRDCDLTFGTKGGGIVAFGLAINSRKLVDGNWVDGDPQFFDIKAFGELAEHAAESFGKGDRVIVSGRLNYSTWEKDGEKKSKVEVIADAIGPELRWATAEVTKSEKRQ